MLESTFSGNFSDTKAPIPEVAFRIRRYRARFCKVGLPSRALNASDLGRGQAALPNRETFSLDWFV